MWAELCMDNKENVLQELDWLIGYLAEYRAAIADNNEDELTRIFKEGSDRKIAIDG